MSIDRSIDDANSTRAPPAPSRTRHRAYLSRALDDRALDDDDADATLRTHPKHPKSIRPVGARARRGRSLEIWIEISAWRGDACDWGYDIVKTMRVRYWRAMRKKSANRKTRPDARRARGARGARARRGEANARRGGRYNVTSIRNEHDAIFDAQRDRAQVRDAIARVRARAR